MKIEILADSGSVAERAAAVIADHVWEAIAARGRFVMAVSGGQTPWVMLCRLAARQIPWRAVHIVQVDERVAPAGHVDRNLTHLHESLLAHTPVSAGQIHPMPVEAGDLETAAAEYAGTLGGLPGRFRSSIWCISGPVPTATRLR